MDFLCEQNFQSKQFYNGRERMWISSEILNFSLDSSNHYWIFPARIPASIHNSTISDLLFMSASVELGRLSIEDFLCVLAAYHLIEMYNFFEHLTAPPNKKKKQK